tara:strand:- start:980 stop:1699 length:720 start_codon:yes stop_codon:yes gene_type:complete
MNILITGGASGLGKAMTIRLCQDPKNKVFFTYKSSKEEAGKIECQFSNAESFKMDFNSQDSIQQFIDKMPELNLDVIVNNAITGYTQNYFHKMETSIFLDSFKINVLPVIQLTQQFIKDSRKKKSGKIITILTSFIINKPPLGLSEYIANKVYLHSLSKSWAVDNSAFGITSNCISPSIMMTNLTKNIDKRLVEGMIDSNPNKCLLNEAEVAEAVYFFVNASSQINGTNFIINAASDLL